MSKLLSLTTLMSEMVRKDSRDGRDHWVVPVVLLTEGVHNNLLYTTEHLEKFPESWNGRPCPVKHPKGPNGAPISANDPAVLDLMNVGTLFNCAWQPANGSVGKLKGEVWVDIERCGQVDEGIDLLRALEKDSKVEVSTGLFIEVDKTPGEWQGEAYEGIATNFRPDHLALLPNDIGACSWADGAGMPRLNEDLQGKNGRFPEWVSNLGTALKVDGLSHESIRQGLSNLVRSSAGEDDFIFVRDVFDGFVIYEKESDKGEAVLFKHGYSVDAQDRVVLTGDAMEVQQQVAFVPVVSPPEINEPPAPQGAELTGVINMDRKDRVDALIANTSCDWSEDQREWLTGLEDDIFENIAKPIEAPAEAPVVNTPEAPPASIESPEDDGAAPKSPEDYIENMEAPEGVKEMFRSGLATHAAQKDGLIRSLIANEACPFSEADLRGKDLEELRKLSLLSKTQETDPVNNDESPEGDFSLRSGLRALTSDEEPLSIPQMSDITDEG